MFKDRILIWKIQEETMESKGTSPQPIILRQTAKQKESTKKSKPISDHSSTTNRMIG
jgi:hypothetical protein